MAMPGSSTDTAQQRHVSTAHIILSIGDGVSDDYRPWIQQRMLDHGARPTVAVWPRSAVSVSLLFMDMLLPEAMQMTKQETSAFVYRSCCLATGAGGVVTPADSTRRETCARYNPDGSIEYMGRKDTQVKVRGLRVELTGIEYSIKDALPQLAHVAVDVSRRDGREALVAFVNLGGHGSDDGRERRSDELADALVPMDDTLRATFAGLADGLRTTLPGYMVPALFLPLRWMPFGATMKLDRKRLRELAGGLEQEQVAAYALADEMKVEPTHGNGVTATRGLGSGAGDQR